MPKPPVDWVKHVDELTHIEATAMGRPHDMEVKVLNDAIAQIAHAVRDLCNEQLEPRPVPLPS